MEVLKDNTVLAILGKGDLIGSDSLTKEQVIKTNANVKALTYCDLQYISLKGLREVLRLYPEYAQKFISEIQHDLTYNLREGHGADVDWESNGGLVKKLPSIREDEEGDEDQSSVSRPARSPLRLSRGLNSPLRSPLLPPRPFRAPSDLNRPATLQIPVVSFCSAAPPELSPRFVDGIETDTNSLCSQKFEFSPSMSPAVSPSPYTGNREPSEIKQSVSKLAEESGAAGDDPPPEAPPPTIPSSNPDDHDAKSNPASQQQRQPIINEHLLGPASPIFFFLTETRLSLPVGRGRHRGCGFARMPLTDSPFTKKASFVSKT
nr:potassium voltage-gated channel subfamily H member 8-like isoform X2 [Pseudochaenichthys georgianus]